MWLTRVLLWFQPPWRKFPSRTILKVKLGGSLTIEPSSPSFSFGRSLNYESIDSLYDLSMLLMLGAYDPRVKALLIDLRPLNCGYAKLKEARRMLDLFRSSGKQIIGYAEVASEKEVYLAMGFTAFYVPPEGTVDLRGFSASATFLRGAFEKIGIEPQVQRIGKYKSFGDTFNRTSIADPQREVVSALLTHASAHWAEDIARRTNRTVQEVAQLWSAEKALSLEDYQRRGIITGVRYWDQVEQMAQDRLRRPGWLFGALRSFVSSIRRVLGRPAIPPVSLLDRHRDDDFDELRLEADFQLHPRRQLQVPPPSAPLSPASAAPLAMLDSASAQAVQEKEARAKQEKAVQAARRMFSTPVLAGGLYLRKMRNGCRILPNLPVREVTRGRRIAIINAAGAIGSGESNRGGLLGASVGAETLTAQLRRARDNPRIKAVVLRIDSPGGSALASDVLWREIRLLSRVKPVVASQVDVAGKDEQYRTVAKKLA
jgi:ClpP class serine protease